MILSDIDTASPEECETDQTHENESTANTEPSGFGSLGLSEGLVEIVEGYGYTSPTPIQAQAIPPLLHGEDVLGQAQTGTGKTAAFALPLLDRIDLSAKYPQVLVLAPTRELAIQVAGAFEKYSGGTRQLNVLPIFGGQDYQIQLRKLKQGPQVVVGTPGRVMDHMRRGTLKLDDLRCFVLDEADEMLRMGFAEDVEWVLSHVPEKRQMALFSATMPGPIRHIAKKHLKEPTEITIEQETATADTIRQRYIVTTPREKQFALSRILEAEPVEGVIVFVKTRNTTGSLAEFLSEAGLKTAALNGDIPQNQRERIVESLRSGRIDVIVATDVAARGLDVERISHVINYDLPHDSESYVHRIGRTGRAGRSGDAILFVHPRERYSLKRLEKATRQPIEQMELPSNRVINKKRIARFHERITKALESSEMELYQSIVEQYQRDNDVAYDSLAAAMAILANGDVPLLVKDKINQASFAKDQRHSDDGRNRSRKRDRRSDIEMETYRIEVGRNHRVQPKNIVGAIANEAGIRSDGIGKIKIFDEFSTVDLPVGLPQGVVKTLQNIFIAGRKLQLSRMSGSPPARVYEQNGQRKKNSKSKPNRRQRA
ncbi:DEAD/DEAH box helicase [Thalassoroseus pseudoceratinae]|uniref:DEAD/DEAH box helicase n=1 Tax=Thalassoroseus pseudoceratinae TaxID=2713176 RepID=UPI0014204668|nr:DEAD/DEAH box helicase [Thalassoroseus pseudoceratinae]